MVKFLKPGKIVIIVRGKYAGKKAVIVKAYDDGTGTRKFGHALVAGIERAPLPIHRNQGTIKQAKRSRIKPFIKLVNYSHLMPTRYGLSELDLKKVVGPEHLAKHRRKAAKRQLNRVFKEHYLKGQDPWFFQKLRF
eukprot:TRINITY_DN3540_c0_g3_i4.p2 TRINITY_DN3540_c0_g3~~TRINITY_DN3540_c0_g3_i4.p2  ORF type:complete len:143 (+),score=31.12 TRINITY_DN3540_c0_g3_i4:24-431(+)